MKKPYEGIRQKLIRLETGQAAVNFTFKDVHPGVYGIRCYQDMNNNGELDRFLIIPKEPWCLSRKDKKKRVPPRFENISFKVDGRVEVNLFLDD